MNIETVQQNISKLKDLKKQIDELNAEYNMIKDDVIYNYFIETNSETLITEKGLVLATYKSYPEYRFNSTKFREDHPDIYDGYKEEKVIYKFLLK